jgi:HlyD family secretion protein
MSKRIVPVIIILLVLAGLGGYYWYTQANPVDTTKLTVSGNIEAVTVNVAAETVGKIKEFKVDEGVAVKKDDVLAQLDDTVAGLSFDQAKAALAVAQLAGNPAQVALAQANYNLAEFNLKRATVTSPLAGTVVDRPFNVGEFASQGAVLFTVADLTKVKLVVYVPENKLGQVKLDQSVDVKTDSYPSTTFKGTITKISNVAEFTPANIQTTEQRVNLVYAVTISLDNPDGKLKSGMPADATISLK